MRFLLFITLVVFSNIVFSHEANAAMSDHPIAKLQALDKSTARTITFEAKVGSTIEYGSLFIKVQSCRKSEPLDKPESAAFVQVWEVPVNSDKSEWIFSGWMFASSPALSAMDHPVYDVWVLDCLDKTGGSSQKKLSKAQKILESVQNSNQAELDKGTASTQAEDVQVIDNSIESITNNSQ